MSHSENYTDTGRTTTFYQGVDAGVSQERERIIKMLEDAREAQPCGCDDCGDHVWGKAIDLIKEEQRSRIDIHEPTCNISEGKWDGGCNCKGEQK